jgi:hypothetical protein
LLKENLSLWKEEDAENNVEDLWSWWADKIKRYEYKDTNMCSKFKNQFYFLKST